MKLIILDPAQAELEEAQAYYLQHATAGIAAAFVADYENGARRLLQFPQAGTSVSPRLRALPMRHFPYSIIYQATPKPLRSVLSPTSAADPGTGAGGAERDDHTRLISVTPAGKSAWFTVTS